MVTREFVAILSGDEYEGMSPACYDEWCCCEDGEV